jgi:hypothetical protein
MDETKLAKLTWKITGGPMAKTCKVFTPDGVDVTDHIVGFSVSGREGFVRVSIDALCSVEIDAAMENVSYPAVEQLPTPKVMRLN